MSSPYVGQPVYSGTITLMTDADQPSAATFRGPLERVIDNTAALNALVLDKHARSRAHAALVPLFAASGVTSEAAIASASAGQFLGNVVVKSGANNSFTIQDTGAIRIEGSVASITSLVTDVACNFLNPPRFLAVGTGGNNCCFSTSFGSAWSAGGAIGFVPSRIVWDGVNSFFLVPNPAGAVVARSSNGAAWANVAPGSITLANGGIAVLAGGVAVVCGGVASVVPAFAVSSNGGSSWANSGGTVVSSATYDDTGSLAGNAGSIVWHVGRRSAGTTLRVSSSPDGASWTTRADLAAPAGVTFNARPRILCCQNTGLLVIIAPTSSNVTASYASLDAGVSWYGPIAQGPYSVPVDAFAVSGGRLFTSATTVILASQGIGGVL